MTPDTVTGVLNNVETEIMSATKILGLVKPTDVTSMREVALVKTKLDEARLWLEEARRVNQL